MDKIVVIQQDNTIEIKDFNGLKSLQDAVDGYIEEITARLNPYQGALSEMEVVYLCNEEGAYRSDFKVNPIATLIYMNPLVGPVAIGKFGIADGEQDIVGFTQEEAAEVKSQLEAFAKSRSRSIDAIVRLENEFDAEKDEL